MTSKTTLQAEPFLTVHMLVFPCMKERDKRKKVKRKKEIKEALLAGWSKTR